MFCTNCGNELTTNQRFCTSCGTSVKGSEESLKVEINQEAQKPVKTPWTFFRVVKYVVVILIVVALLSIKLIVSAINTSNNTAVTSNDKGINALQSGDYDGAITHLEKASDSAVGGSTKMNVLTNLAYAYSSDGRDTEALAKFREALPYATANSFDYYLISGEIALLEGKPQEALTNYTSAYNLKPDDFQINNALNLFYLDINDKYPTFSDPQKALGYALKAYQTTAPETKGTATENLAIAYFLTKDFDKAIQYFKQTNQSQPTVQLWLGMSYFALEDYDTAKPYLQRADNGGVAEAKQFLDKY